MCVFEYKRNAGLVCPKILKNFNFNNEISLIQVWAVLSTTNVENKANIINSKLLFNSYYWGLG